MSEELLCKPQPYFCQKNTASEGLFVDFLVSTTFHFLTKTCVRPSKVLYKIENLPMSAEPETRSIAGPKEQRSRTLKAETLLFVSCATKQ